jgi:hypothetical protein
VGTACGGSCCGAVLCLLLLRRCAVDRPLSLCLIAAHLSHLRLIWTARWVCALVFPVRRVVRGGACIGGSGTVTVLLERRKMCVMGRGTSMKCKICTAMHGSSLVNILESGYTTSDSGFLDFKSNPNLRHPGFETSHAQINVQWSEFEPALTSVVWIQDILAS